MADKQFVRSGPTDHNHLSDDDPLSELARIVGYDAPPVVHQQRQLQELHEARRPQAAEFDLEDELMRAFDDYDVPKREPTRPQAPVARIQEPTFEDNSFHAPVFADVADTAAPRHDIGDDLLSEVEQYAVPAAAAPAPAPAKKINYPFTPSFSRATPVAAGAGVGQRAFATPLPPRTQAPEPAPVAPARVEPPAAPVAQAPVEPDVEVSDFDLDNFEIDLSEMDMELNEAVASDAPVFEEPEPVAKAYSAPPPPVSTPAAQAYQPARFEADAHEDIVESELPFDPAMIADSEETVSPMADMDVPQLPAVEQDDPPTHEPDYDYDIDAEIAQLFAPQQGGEVRADAAPAASWKAGAEPKRAGKPEQDSDEFERLLEEDFRRSLNTPRAAEPAVDRRPISPDIAVTDGFYEDDNRRSPLKLGLIAAGVLGVVVLGGAGVYAWMGNDSTTASGAPQVILADKDPVKIVPTEPGGKTVPNQDKAVYDRVAGTQSADPTQSALVSSTEEPVDVVQRTLADDSLPLEGNDEADSGAVDAVSGADAAAGDERLAPSEDEANAGGGEESAPSVSPRKVKTMIVKPDGTLVAREVSAPEPETDVATASTTPVSAASSALADVASADVGNAAPVRTVTTAPVEARSTPAATPKPPVVAPVETAAVAPEQLATPPANPGGYVLQIASLPSEADAKSSYANLSGKFAGIIGGRGVDIRKADIAGKGTYYRVRIPAGSRSEANALCSRYKGAGGSCIVTK
ncbi:SPOR domain-containing protein [Rhizobium sp. CFBP 8762]|uniref:SPOR domain-containing protein n=2 Tax=Rhizobium sp. CFBP 8762 TaxID=2775279 RepID=UPI00177B5AB4|nr:SPOR domain-containing protein [Rhizobium sp. CFBP 8762]MBD8554629.1 SPOR domain-containing protein [Rhizobium sp. CFBP 8762]